MVRPALPLAVLGVLWLVRRRRKHRRRGDDDSCSVDSLGSSFTQGSATEMPAGAVVRAPGLSTVQEDDQHHEHNEMRPSRRRKPPGYSFLSWDQLLVILMLLVAMALGLQRQAWDVTALLGILLFVTLLAPLVRSLRRRRRHWSRGALSSEPQGTDAAAVSVTTASQSALTKPDLRLAGTWLKDSRASDSMQTACDIMQLNGVVRLAVGLVKGIEIHFHEQVVEGRLAPDVIMEMAVFSVVSWFKVRERYLLNGSAAQWKRRDLRRGKHTGTAVVLPDGGIRLDLEWPPPLGGKGLDEFRLENDNELHVTSHLTVGARKHTYTQVYRRKR